MFVQELTITITALALLSTHYFPWTKVLGRSLTKLESYIIGSVCLLMPPSFIIPWEYAKLYYLCLINGGALVIFLHIFDDLLNKRIITETLKQENAILRGGNDPKDHIA